MLQFSQDLNSAVQIKASASQFICHNLAPLIESRALSVLDEDTLEALAHYYRREYLPKLICRRSITPSSEGPSLKQMEELLESYGDSLTAEDILDDEVALAQEARQQQKQQHQQGGSAK